jgi:Flp pilus assembly protein TadD
LLLTLAVAALYWPALQNGFVNYDDDRYVTANVQVQGGLSGANLVWAFTHPVADNWHPLTVLSHMLVCQFCGLHPWGHHLVNVLLHAVNAGLVFLLLHQLTGARWRSLLVAALFAAHPLRVESVAWVAERKDVLSACFGLLSLIFYARFARGRNSGECQDQALKKDHPSSSILLPVEGRRKDREPLRDNTGTVISSVALSRDYWLALGWFTLGLMSKPMLVTWPFVLLLLDYWPLGRLRNLPRGTGLNWSRLLLEKLPFFILAAVFSAVTFVVQRQGAAVETMQNLSLPGRCENALLACGRYLLKTVWPVDLAVFYPRPDHWPMAEVVFAAIFLVCVTALLIGLRRRFPFLLMGWLWYLGTLIPVIGLVQVGLQSMADRYTYLPSLGILIALVWGVERLARSRPPLQAVLTLAGVSAVLVCAGLTRAQLPYWQDGETLFRHALAVTGSNPIAGYNLGVALDEKDRMDEAVIEYQKVLDLQPDNTLARLNLGTDLDRAGRLEEAIPEYQRVIQLEPNNPKAHNDLGIALFKLGRNDEAVPEFQAAVRLEPESAEAHNSLAAALFTRGDAEGAIGEFQAALRLRSDYVEAHFNLGCILASRGQTGEAIKQLQEAIRLKPDYAEARERLAKLTQPQ